jgi:hypothetical protein
MTKTITILAISTILVSVTFIPLAEGTAGWNGFLREIGLGGTQVYEVSGVSVMPAGTVTGSEVQLRCLDGDYFFSTSTDFVQNPINIRTDAIFLSIDDPSIDTTNLGIVAIGSSVEERIPGIRNDRAKVIGYDVTTINDGPDVLVDVPVTITGVCLSPSPLSSVVGGEWQGTDTVALFIGYSVLNAYWLAPTLAGIGAGIYLTKSKWKR